MNREADLAAQQYSHPDYEYGNRTPIEVIRLMPSLEGSGIDPHASLELDNSAGVAERAYFTEQELEEKVEEIAANYHVIGDPKAEEDKPQEFGITVANGHALEQDGDTILVMSTQGSNLYDEEGKPNNVGNALELAYTALKYPDKAVVYAESPGTGNSDDLTDDEYKKASKDGKLVEESKDSSGHIVDAEATETLQALARALEADGIDITHISANVTGAHFASALGVALPENLQRMFLYNSTNVSDRNPLVMTAAGLKEIVTQGKYAKASQDPLKLTEDRKSMAEKVLTSASKGRIAQRKKTGTHNPVKMWRQQRIFSRGNRTGQAAAVHSVANQVKHPGIKVTHVFPEFAAQYKSPEDFEDFVYLIDLLGGIAVQRTDVETLKIPMGQYGHSNYPSVRQTLESGSFNR